MTTLKVPVLCYGVSHLESRRVPTATRFAGNYFTKRESTLWSFMCSRDIDLVSFAKSIRKSKGLSICCSLGSSDGNESMTGNFSESEEDYVNSSVMEAVRVRRGSEGVIIEMKDHQNLRCVYDNPQAVGWPDYKPRPAIVLKMEDGSGLLLPIIVLELPSILLMAAVEDVKLARPTMYEVFKEMTEIMGYAVKRVRVTKSVDAAYHAEVYLAKIGDDNAATKVIDCRPSDAINVAVRCKVPIQVNKSILYRDGMRVIEHTKLGSATPSDGILFTELDRPDGQPCLESKEFDLVRNMLIAAVEERYKDAALWRDRLNQLRAKRKNWA